MANIDFDTFEWKDDFRQDHVRIFRWRKNNTVVKEVRLNAMDMLNAEPICPACFYWRGEVVHMKQTVVARVGISPSQPYTLTASKCPTCRGSIPAYDGRQPLTVCDCGQIPHRVFCQMGYLNYFYKSEER